tara:strand:- start:312 stop:614 length:303 start_codon:yes stop_codon:yes gene_type:complete
VLTHATTHSRDRWQTVEKTMSQENSKFDFNEWRKESNKKLGITEDESPYLKLIKINEEQIRLCKEEGIDTTEREELVNLLKETYQQSIQQNENYEKPEEN